MPVMKAHFTEDPDKSITLYEGDNSGPGKITSTSVILNFPPHYALTNFHVWFIYVANQFFVQNQWRPSFVCGMQKEWKKYEHILEYLYDHARLNASFKGLMAPVLDHTDDLDVVIDYGKTIVHEWEDLIATIDSDISSFLKELKLPAILKEHEHLFTLWYEGKFESTSHVHRDAYRTRASSANTSSMISTLLLTMPQQFIPLAFKKTMESDLHTHYWVYNEVTCLLECHCGKEETVQSRYQKTY